MECIDSRNDFIQHEENHGEKNMVLLPNIT